MPTGGLIGLRRRGTIIKYLGNGKVTVKLDDATSESPDENTHEVSLPIAFVSADGAFIGGYPEPDTPVTVEQGQGEWFISAYEKPDNVFPNKNVTGTGGISSNLMAELLPGRLLLQTNNASNRLFLDPIDGIVSGTSASSQHIDPNRDIISHNFGNEMAFTLAHRAIRGVIQRDIHFNSLRNIDGSILYSHSYDDNLWPIGMDPASVPSGVTLSGVVRNMPLAEDREITYEFADLDGLDFEADEIEIDKYGQSLTSNTKTIQKGVLRPESRANTFGLNLHWPNHLIETIKGTGVDTFGNIIDLNRSILPLGRDITFIGNDDYSDVFKKIRATHRKALAYHFEINARKSDSADEDGLFSVLPVESAESRKNYARTRSTLFVDIDKEGQFKINIPSSSEIGNIPLPTRYVLSSTIAYENNDIESPNTFIMEDEGDDIFLEAYGYAGTPDSDDSLVGITLKGEEGESAPTEWFYEKPIKLNTSFHNILQAGYQFTKTRVEDDPGGLLVRYMPSSRLNEEQDTIQVDDVVKDEIIVSGVEANAGGRSGTISMDGFLSMNLGANTIDRQSLWLDTAGGIVSTIGRDKRGISYCASLDGDMLVQIGGFGLGGGQDNRFVAENDGARSGALDIRVIKNDGQLTIIRVDQQGVAMATYGRVEMMAQQDMVFKSNTNIMFEAPNIGFYYETAEGRWIKRTMAKELA